MTDPATLEEALGLIAMLQKKAEHAIEQREAAREQALTMGQGFAKRAELWRDVMRVAKKTIDALTAYIEYECPAGPLRYQTVDAATNASEMLDRALSK